MLYDHTRTDRLSFYLQRNDMLLQPQHYRQALFTPVQNDYDNLSVGILNGSHIQLIHVNVHFNVPLDMEFGQKENGLAMA